MIDRTVNVLLVEDNGVDVEAVRRAFQQHKIGNPLFVAKDGLDALHRLRGTNGTERIARPYLVLLDLNMPRMNGIEFLREIRADEELRDSIVFVLTTSKSDEDKVASYRFNIAGYMVKSDVGVGFMRMVDLIDHYWRIVEFPPDKR